MGERLGWESRPSPAGSFTLPAVEHYREEFSGELFIDAVSGATATDGATIMGNRIGADGEERVGLIVPGGSLAVKVAKLAIDQAEQRSTT